MKNQNILKLIVFLIKKKKFLELKNLFLINN